MKKILCVLFALVTVLSALSVSSSAQEPAFVDVPDGAWYAGFVADCVAKGLMTGTSETTFSPDETMTRAMFVQTIYKYYQMNIQGTDKDLNHLGHDADYVGGNVGTVTKVDGANPFTVEQTSIILTDPDDPSTETEVKYTATREQLISGSFEPGFYALDVKHDEDNIISFESRETLTLVPESPTDPCSIFISGGNCVGSGFSGFAKRVTVSSSEAKAEAQTEDGAEFEIVLCDLGSRTAVIVRGVSSGELSAELYGYDLTVKGAKDEYTVEVYDWAWEIEGDVLKQYTCTADTEESSALPFSDVENGAYYTEALKWAKMRKLTAGISKTEFAPDAPVTREQIAVFINRFIRTYNLDYVTKDLIFNFTDGKDISAFAKESVETAAKTGMMVGDKFGRFNPKAPAKRCEVATVFSNLYNVIAG